MIRMTFTIVNKKFTARTKKLKYNIKTRLRKKNGECGIEKVKSVPHLYSKGSRFLEVLVYQPLKLFRIGLLDEEARRNVYV